MARCPVLAGTTQLWRRPAPLCCQWRFFMDGVAYSHTDSVLGVWAINMISQNRHVVALIRKRQMCQGGCQGWGVPSSF